MKTLRAILETNWSGYDDYSKRNKNTSHLHDSLSKHYKDFEMPEKSSIRYYTDGSSAINSYHWENHKSSTKYENAELEGHTKKLDAALSRHKTPHKLTVYSGVRADFDPRKKKDENGIVHHPAYISTSIDQHRTRNFAEAGSKSYGRTSHVLKINVPKGHHGAYVDHISSIPGENEFILPRGTNLKYKKTVTHAVKAKYDRGTEFIHEHHMDIVK